MYEHGAHMVIHEEEGHEKEGYFNHERWLTQRGWSDSEMDILTIMWLTQRLYACQRECVFYPKRRVLLVLIVAVWSVGKKTWNTFNLNCTKVYERRWILWITVAYASYPKILKTRIGRIPLILLYCLLANFCLCYWIKIEYILTYIGLIRRFMDLSINKTLNNFLYCCSIVHLWFW